MIKGKNGLETKTYKMYKFLDEGNEPTREEFAKFIYGASTYREVQLISQMMRGVKKHFLKEGVLIGSLYNKETKEFRYKKYESAEEVAQQIPRSEKSSISHYKNLLIASDYLKHNFPEAKQFNIMARRSILTVHKAIVDDELSALNTSNNDNPKHLLK